MCVLRVSTGNIAVCSTTPATEPASMYCQNRRPSWVAATASTGLGGSCACSSAAAAERRRSGVR
uniref:Uncharacterized protein n=1 Tax=Oryza punctata TaxID=4537 RepID=A0A0E0KCI9_ORYPU